MSGVKREIDKLVLVVHGVGDPSPGETVSLLARSLAEDQSPLEEKQEIVWLPEKSHDDNQIRTFATHIRHLNFGTSQVEMAEVFWGDLSRVRKGILGAIYGIFQIIFGFRYVAYIAADQPGVGAEWLKRMGLISSRILHGPVLAVTFYLAILSTAVLATQLMWTESYKSIVWTQVILCGCGMVAIASANIGSQITSSRVIARFWFWVNVTAFFVGGLMFIKPLFLEAQIPELAHSMRPGLIWYCRILVVLLGFLWFVEMLVLGGLAACWFFALLHPRAYHPALHVAILLPALAVGIWGQAMPMLWISAREGIRRLGELPDFYSIFDEAIAFLGVQFMMLIVLVGATIFVLVRYFRWRANTGVEDYLNGKPQPRLIVHGGLQFVFAACTVVGVMLVFVIGMIQLLGTLNVISYSLDDSLLAKILAETNKYAVGVLVPLGGILFFLVPHLRPGFDILLDVVNHFYFRSTNVQDALDDEDEFDITETTFESGSLFFSRRDAIHCRLKRILTYYRDRLSQQTELVLVAHSQGTMIAIEVLNDAELGWLRNRFHRISLVTLGSPMTNLYQHYFRHLYPPLAKPFWSELRKRVDRWINVFRVDDYVGREIDFPVDHQVPGWERGGDQKTVYSNHAVGPRGHQGYWVDREVLDILREQFSVAEQEQKKSAA